MKKKFSFVLAVLMIVCTLSIALVACAPKDPDPFTAADKESTLNEVWDAWAKQNIANVTDTLGLDINLNFKNADTDLGIAFKGGVTAAKNALDKEVFNLAITDNKIEGANKNVLNATITNKAVYLDIPAFYSVFNKPIQIDGFGEIPNLGGMVNGLLPLDGLSTALKSIIVSLVGNGVDNVTIDPVLADKKAKLYDVTYSFDIDMADVVDAIVLFVQEAAGESVPAETVDMVANEIKNLIGDLKLSIKAETTGNAQEKVKKPAKGAPKYSYSGGTMKKLGMKATMNGGSIDVNNSIKLKNSIPTVEIPTDVINLEKALFTSRLNGNINLKDAKGEVVSHYTYSINLDFTPIQLISTIVECVNTGSADALINKMIKDQQGKIFVEVNHTCGDVCKSTHVGGKKADGSIIAIAYSPEDFENNRVYVSLDLRTIVNDSLLQDMIGISMNTLFPTYYTTFSFDFLQYMDLVATRNSVSTSAVAGLSTVADEEVAGFDIGAMLGRIIAGLKNDQELQIGIKDIQDILNEYIRPILKENDPAEGTYWTIDKAIRSLFNGVDKICIDTVYTHSTPFEENVLDLFTRVKDGSDAKKDFGENGIIDDKGDVTQAPANHRIIKGDVLDWDKDAAGNVKIYAGGSGDTLNNSDLNSIVYDENGAYKTMSYGELMELVVDKNATSTKNTVVIRFKDLYGNDVESRMNIVEIAGLDPNVYTEQTVKLVLSNGGADKDSAGIGSSINNLLGTLKGLAGLVPQLAMLNELVTPEVVIETKITIYEVESAVWDQSKVAGITEAQIFDETREVYANGDALSDKNHLTVTFANGTIHETDVTASNTKNYIKSNKVAAWGTFTMQFAAFGEYCDITVPMDSTKGVDNQTVSLLLGEDGTVEYKISNSIKNNTINGSMSLQEAETMATVQAFAEENGFGYEATSNFLGWTGAKIIFNKRGTYNLTLIGGHNATLNLTFIVIEHSVNETLYLGVSKEYNGKIGNFEFTKEEAEKAAKLNTNTNMTITVAGTDAEPTIKVDFARTGKYTMTIVDKNGDYVIVNYDIKEPAATVSGLELNTENSIRLNEQFAGITFEKEVIEAAVQAFNTQYTGKITMTFNGDMEDPTLTFTAIDNNGYSGFIMNIDGTNGEKAKLTIKHNTKSVSKEGYVGGDKVVVTEDEIGVPFTKEFAESLANSQNNGSNKTKFTVAVVEQEDGKLAFEFTLLQPNNNTFTLTNKCSISIKALYVVNVNATVGTDLVLEKGTAEGQLNHSYSKYNFSTPVTTFNTTYADKATVELNESTLALTFNFAEAGEYELVVTNMTINITVTAAEA